MSYLKTVKPEQATGLVAEIYKPMQEMVGMVPAPLQLMSASPGLMAIQVPFMKYYMDHPNLSQGLLALIRMLVAEETQYTYCISFNRGVLAKMGVAGDDELGAIMADPDKAPIAEKEKAMLKAVLVACSNPAAFSQADVQNLRDLGWQDSDVMDAICHGLMMVQGGMLEKAVGLPEGAAC